MVNMQQALGVDDFNQMSNYTGQLQNQRRSVGQKQYGLGGKVLNMAAALGDAYNQYQPPETALGMMALPAKAVYGLGNMIVQDVGDKTKSIMGTDINNPAAMNQAATDAFGLAADTMAGGGVVSRMTDMPQGAILGANVFQGGPHKYGPEGAAESLKHMSKGEGAQAYGWGRYDAENPEVAKTYKPTTKQDVELSTADRIAELEKLSNDELGKLAYNEFGIELKGDDLTEAIDDWLIKDLADSEQFTFSLRDPVVDSSYIYKHDLPDEDIARYLDWDAPLSEQPENVKAAYAKIREKDLDTPAADAFNEQTGNVSDPTGQNIYKRLQSHRMAPDVLNRLDIDQISPDGVNYLKAGTTDEMASQYLQSHGIPGLKYFDGMSRKRPIAGLEKIRADLISVRKEFEQMPKGQQRTTNLAAQDAQIAQIDADIKIALSDKPQTRNFVTWDQDVLNRMKLLERNNESMVDALSGVNNK